MENSYFIKDGTIWFGPMSENEFINRRDEIQDPEYWKPEFCPNKVLHPHFCEHTKIWKEPVTNKEETFAAAEEDLPSESVAEGENEKEKITKQGGDWVFDKAHPEGKTPHRFPEKEEQSSGPENAHRSNNFGFKLAVIIIGFLLVFGAGFYVNSKLSVMFYQDIIIRESVKNMEYNTRDLINESRKIKADLDTLNVLVTEEVKSLKKQIEEINDKLSRLNYQPQNN